jgi:phosphoribosylaminoimidazolecarboxamide formyltransferase/IMP cyclohydrolase
MKKNKSAVTRETNFRLAVKVFDTTAQYDRMIADYLQGRLTNQQ